MNSATLSLFSPGMTTGLVVEAGHSLISCVPIFEGFLIPHAIQKSTLAGNLLILISRGGNNETSRSTPETKIIIIRT